jgi:hypothetical protein
MKEKIYGQDSSSFKKEETVETSFGGKKSTVTQFFNQEKNQGSVRIIVSQNPVDKETHKSLNPKLRVCL